MVVRVALLVLLTKLMHIYFMSVTTYIVCARGLLPHATMSSVLLVLGSIIRYP